MCPKFSQFRESRNQNFTNIFAICKKMIFLFENVENLFLGGQIFHQI